MAERSRGAVRGMAADFCTHCDLRGHPTQRHTHRAAPNTPDTAPSTQCNEMLMHIAILPVKKMRLFSFFSHHL
jgi:hypothetical protein